jgi:hypothetical protein
MLGLRRCWWSLIDQGYQNCAFGLVQLWFFVKFYATVSAMVIG